MTPRQMIQTAEAATKFVEARNARRNAKRAPAVGGPADGEPPYATLKSRQAVALRRLATVVNRALALEFKPERKTKTSNDNQGQFSWESTKTKGPRHDGSPVDQSSNT